jgi:hypothetical protein
MPGYIEVKLFRNNGNQATVRWTATNNAQFNKLDDYIDEVYGSADPADRIEFIVNDVLYPAMKKVRRYDQAKAAEDVDPI